MPSKRDRSGASKADSAPTELFSRIASGARNASDGQPLELSPEEMAFLGDSESSDDDDDDESDEPDEDAVDSSDDGADSQEDAGEAADAEAAQESKLTELVQNLAELSDSSDDEGPLIRTGNVPDHWYANEEHLGYDIDGKKVAKRSGGGDAIDTLLDEADNPNAKRTIYDKKNDRHIVLSNEELNIINRLRKGHYATSTVNDNQDYVDWYTKDRVLTSMNPDIIEPKRRFIPSKWEEKRIVRMIHAIRNGWIGTADLKKRQAKDDKFKPFLLWDDSGNVFDPEGGRYKPPPAIAAPKTALPGHAESYNPPEEYVMTEEEIQAWEELDPEDRPTNFQPQKHDALRHVGLYEDGIKERFERCLDLYLCPRARRRKLRIDPESLIKQYKLPKPADLKPFPEKLAIEYKGHTGFIRTMATDTKGQWLFTGSDDQSVKQWEVSTGRCYSTWKFPGVVQHIAHHPILPMLAVCCQERVFLIVTKAGPRQDRDKARQLLRLQAEPNAVTKKLATWAVGQKGDEVRVSVEFSAAVKRMCWHAKGDYFATVTDSQSATNVLVHRLSLKQSQAPFSKAKGSVENVIFHHQKPIFFVFTQRNVRVYNLAKQEMVKKLLSSAQHISAGALHQRGDHILVGSYDRRVLFYDLDLGVKPFKTLKYHQKAVRQVAFHATYPLFASCSDDGSIQIFHCKIFNDLMTNPQIVPVKVLQAHPSSQEETGGLGVLDCAFHPSQPWIFSAGADKVARLFT